MDSRHNVEDRPGPGWTLPLLAVAVAAVFSRSLVCDFVDFDDDLYITENARIQEGLNGDTFRWIWTANVGVQWYPLTLLSHLTDVSLYGLNPGGHHATSVILHMFNSVLLYLALFALTRAAWPCLAVAALWAMHPLRVESVAWVAERKDVLCGFFWFLAMWAWAAYARDGKRPLYLAALAAFACALMSKPMAVTFPFALLLLDLWPLRRVANAAEGNGRRAATLIVEKLPFLALAGAAAVATIVTQSAGGAVASTASMPVSTRVLNALGGYAVYAWQSIWPAGLAIAYPVPERGVLWARATAGAGLVALWLIAGWRLRRSRPYVLTGGLWFFGVLAPVIGIIQVGAQSHADRYTYLPQVGLLVACVWFAWDRLKLRARWLRVAGWTTAAVCALLGAASWVQTGHWRSSEALFARALSVTPANSRAELGYGNALLESGRATESVAHFERALELEAGLVHARRGLALALANSGEFDRALRIAREGLERYPDDPDFLSVAGRSALNLDRTTEAVAVLERLVELRPANTGGWVNLGIAYGKSGRAADAQRAFDAALRIDPNQLEALYNSGVMYAQAGDAARARERFETVLRLAPDYALARESLRALESAQTDP